ncbi:hypothetical protein GCM10007918_56080 [Piscinibacter gummiphilus]|nr:hypothetical protein GCM10007918_56080 [Piscinibacter gummiphilus]
MDADCTSATITGDVVSDVIIHAAATSFIHMQMLAVSQTLHNMRNTGCESGAQGDTSAAGGVGSAGWVWMIGSGGEPSMLTMIQ